jgi:hypothetical protein
MTQSSSHRVQPEFVDALVNYLKPSALRPVNYAGEPPAGLPQRGGEADPRRVRVFNARRARAAPTLDKNGFELHSHRSALIDFGDEAAIRSVYYAEAEGLIKAATGADKVVVFDHTRRYGLPGHTEAGIRETASRVHNDQTFTSGPRRVRDHLPPEEAEARLKKRHAIINFWRPTNYPVETWPLAFCDANSIAAEDLVPTDLVYADKVGETYSFTHNPNHRWSYFPLLTPGEVVLLKIYDSRTNGTARLTAHTAFEDPTSPVDALHRRSIELRTLVFWD